jgi:hypothetical protein
VENITIPMEEYKELLIIKGKYEELKQQKMILDLGKPVEITPEYPYKIYCKGE